MCYVTRGREGREGRGGEGRGEEGGTEGGRGGREGRGGRRGMTVIHILLAPYFPYLPCLSDQEKTSAGSILDISKYRDTCERSISILGSIAILRSIEDRMNRCLPVDIWAIFHLGVVHNYQHL